MIRISLIAAVCCLALTCPAQAPFRAFSSTVNMIEGGPVETLEIISGSEHITVRVPHGLSSSVDEDLHRVAFNDKSGALTIVLQVTTNSPGVLPPDDALRARALAANPGGNFLQLSSVGTQYRPGKFVDSFRAVDDHLTIKKRHAFVPCPDGLVELVLAANNADFEKARLTLGLMLGSFQVRPEKPAAP